MRISKSLGITASIVALGLGLLVWSFMPRPIVVETAYVRQGIFQASYNEDGKTRLRNRYTVSAPFTGTLLRPRLKAGDEVKQGDIIATLYSAPSPLLDARTKADLQERIGIAEANRDEATILMENARITYAEALKDYERITTLFESGTVTRQNMDRAKLAKDIAERNQSAAETRRHATEHMLEQAKQLVASFDAHQYDEPWAIKAPISGTIIKTYQESEGVVANGTALFDIGDLKDLEVIADILTTDSVAIQPGQRVLIDKWGGDTVLEGRVRYVEPAATTKLSALGIEEQRTPLVIYIVSPPSLWQKLGDQFRVNVTVVTEEIEGATLIPTSAIFQKQDGEYAFVVSGPVADLRQIKIGQRSHGVATVQSGVKNGEQVIVYPPQNLANGSKIIKRH